MSSNSSYSNSSEVRTTRYAIKANIETTRYFDSPLPDIEQQVAQNTQDISDLQLQLDLKENVSDHEADAEELRSSVSELSSELITKESIIAHNTDISPLQSAINLKEDATAHANDVSSLQSSLSDLSASVALKEDISAHNADITTLQSDISDCQRNISITRIDLSTVSSEVGYLSQDLTSLSSTVSTNTSNIATNTFNIATNTTEINNIKGLIGNIPINPYEGLYTSIYDSVSRAALQYNYAIGSMIFWVSSNIYTTVINNNDQNYQINDDVTSIILPGTIKQLNSDGTINQVIRKILYKIEAVNSDSRKVMNTLTTITTLPDVYSLDLDLTGAPNLKYYNLFEGLQELTLSSNSIEAPPFQLPLYNPLNNPL